MKKWFVLSLALVAAAVSHAVTVSWVVSNSSYNTNSWAYNTTPTQDGGKVFDGLNISIYFVYSAKEMTVEGAYGLVANPGSSSSLSFETKVVVGNVMEDPLYTGGEVRAYANNLPPSPSTDAQDYNLVKGSGYYYMVVINNAGDYAVAGTKTEVTFSDSVATMGKNEGGVYASNVGFEPEPEDYFDMGWLGGTLGDAFVPEPTILALLAMGVAGVALRRKQNFLK